MSARNDKEIEKEIRRIEGQLLVAKQICRENLQEINHLKIQQKDNIVLQEIHRLLSFKKLYSNEHVHQFNKLLNLISEREKRQTNVSDTTIRYDEQEKQNHQYNSLLIDLSSNVTELESLFDYGKNLFTQPISSINMLNKTVSLQEIADDSTNENTRRQESINIIDLQKRIEIMNKKLMNTNQVDECIIQ